MPRLALLTLLLAPLGCSALPRPVQQAVVVNPYPQLARVAVAPFFNLSSESTVDGRQFALAYYNELQLVPGFEVVPMGRVEHELRSYGLSLDNPDDARRLAQLLGVDAVVVGAITDFTPYYPPRCALRVEWYAADPTLAEIPPGHGLPWDTTAACDIPERLVYETDMAAARGQLPVPIPPSGPPLELLPPGEDPEAEGVKLLSQLEGAGTDDTAVTPSPDGARGVWPATGEPVMQHTAMYNGHDAHLAASLRNYVALRDDLRFGGWEAYLQRSDDFIRFCCHLHIRELLTARGGAMESRVVWRWPSGR